MGFPGTDEFVKTRLVAFAELLGDNEVQRLAGRLSFVKSEDALGPGVPKPDNALAIDKEHRIRCLAHQGTAETIKVEIRIHGRIPSGETRAAA